MSNVDLFMIDKINLDEKFALFNDYWSPKIITRLNNSQIKLVKFQGEFVWHHHDNADELFLVIKGRLLIKLRDCDIFLNEGELLVIPKTIEHKPIAEKEVSIVLIEPLGTLNTGNIQNEKTQTKDEYI
jgi:mannose-6-phosphate isomerase-like protein (cupin superfamily)